MVPGMDGSPANEKPHRDNGLARDLPHSQVDFPGRAGRMRHGTLPSLPLAAVILTAPAAMGFAVRDAQQHLQPGGSSSPALLCQHPLLLSATGTDLPDPPCLAGQEQEQEQDLHVMQPQHRAAALPLPQPQRSLLGAVLGARLFSLPQICFTQGNPAVRCHLRGTKNFRCS